MPRFPASVLITVAATVCIAALVFTVSGRSADERTDEQSFPLPQSARSMPGAKVGLEAEKSGNSTDGEPRRTPGCPNRESGEGRIGSFERPGQEVVPEYEVLQKSENGREGVCGKSLLVDTRVRDGRDLALITRDLKARYARFDAVSVEFTDSTTTLAYTGGAVIVNTTEGSFYAGYIYGPPNDRGYITRAAD